MGKKDLDSIFIKKENILPQREQDTLLDTTKKNFRKPYKERDSEILSIKITPTEMSTIIENKEREAGRMAPLGTYVKDYLRTKTDLFSKR
jgi:hypothetical protein